MRTLIKFVAVCAAITVAVGYVKRRTRPDDGEHKRARSDHAAAPVVAPELPHVPGHPVEAETPPTPPMPPGETIRIVTSNGVGFLSLRGESVVGGLSDSIRSLAEREMQKSLAEDSEKSRVGRAIAKAVVGGVSQLLNKELTVPLTDLEDVQFVGDRIVFRYRSSSKPTLEFNDFKSNNKEFLAQFNPDEARVFVEQVRVKLGKS